MLLSGATQELVRDSLPEGADLLDLGEHWLKDLVRPERVYQLVHPDLPGRFPPLESLRGQPHNLPAQPTALVGRDQQVEELAQWFQREETRLVTLTGPGGVGKTRLGLQVAAESLRHFPDGVFVVELVPIRDHHLVMAAIAPVLGVRDSGSQPLLEALKQYLRDKRLLLVLDNFEQLLPAARGVTELLAAAPGVKMLVTSRAPLHVPGEQEYPVPPLPVPGIQVLRRAGVQGEAAAAASFPLTRTPDSLDTLSTFPGVQLFLQRGRDVRPDFTMTVENAPAVAEICRRLEGLPLAIELAAARLRALSVEQIAARLGDRLRLLTGGSRAATARQRTLRGSIDWSYELLSGPERALLRRLPVFSGGWTLAAAEAICADPVDGRWLMVDGPDRPEPSTINDQLSTHEVLDHLTELVAHSVVLYEERNGAPRYRMLDTIREYAREQAETEPDVARTVANRHARYYREFAEARVARIRTPDRTHALDELDQELDNLRTALTWARVDGQGELCARLALVLYHPLYGQGLWEEARGDLEVGLAALAETGTDRPALRAALQYHLASLAEDRGDHEEARKQAEASLAVRRQLGDSLTTADSLNLLGKLANNEGDAAAARALQGEGLLLVGDRGPIIRGKILHNLGVLASSQGDVDSARRLYAEGLAEFRQAQDPYAEARLLGDFGVLVQEHDRDGGEARRLYLDALAAYRQSRDPQGVAVMLNNLGELAELEGSVESAVVLFLHAERIFRGLRSLFVAQPAAALRRMAGQFDRDRWAELMAVAEGTTWEELLGQDRPPSSPRALQA